MHPCRCTSSHDECLCIYFYVHQLKAALCTRLSSPEEHRDSSVAAGCAVSIAVCALHHLVPPRWANRFFFRSCAPSIKPEFPRPCLSPYELLFFFFLSLGGRNTSRSGGVCGVRPVLRVGGDDAKSGVQGGPSGGAGKQQAVDRSINFMLRESLSFFLLVCGVVRVAMYPGFVFALFVRQFLIARASPLTRVWMLVPRGRQLYPSLRVSSHTDGLEAFTSFVCRWPKLAYGYVCLPPSLRGEPCCRY